jgi:hypothetical protein
MHRSIAAVVAGVLLAAGAAPAAAQAPGLSIPEVVEPVRNVVEPVRNVVEPVRNVVEPVRNVVEPVRNVVEPVRDAVPPARVPDAPVTPSPQPVERPAPVTRTAPTSPARAPADPSPAPPTGVTEAEPAGTSGPAAHVAPAPGRPRSAPRSISAAPPMSNSRRAAARPPARRERRLRRVVADLSECLHTLGRLQRRVLMLRAGVGEVRPHSRRAVAGRLDTTIRNVVRAERRGLRALRRSARAGRCAEPMTLVASASPAGGTAPTATTGPVADRGPDGQAGSPVSGVRDEFRSSSPPDEPATILVTPSATGEPPLALLLGAAFLAGFAIVWARERRRIRRRPPAARGS